VFPVGIASIHRQCSRILDTAFASFDAALPEGFHADRWLFMRLALLHFFDETLLPEKRCAFGFVSLDIVLLPNASEHGVRSFASSRLHLLLN
jgi:hypothetical protein